MTALPAEYADDPFTIASAPAARWTTANTGEQMPGVLTPLTISLIGPPAELGIYSGFSRLGVIAHDEVRLPEHRADLHLGFFLGRCAVNVGIIRRLFDLSPGTSGAAYEEQMFGGEGLGESERLPLLRWPIVAVRMPLVLLRAPTDLRRLRAELQEWWGDAVARAQDASMDEARAICLDAQRQMGRVMPLVWIATLGAQLAYVRLCALAAEAGHAGLETTLAGGYGTEEMDIANDLWSVSRERMSRDAFLARHGWTVPEGIELSAPSWREQPEALDGLLDRYRAMPDTADPALAASRRAEERHEAERLLLGALPRHRRLPVRLLLRVLGDYMQLRTIQKAADAITWDPMRASARRMGALLVADGVLADADDAFFLTASELLGGPVLADAAERVARRRAQREAYLDLRLPDWWTGQPEPLAPPEREEASGPVTGMGVSPGVVEGLVRVVSSPTDATVEPGEILVCETTDPSWISLMVVAAGLVIDVGGPVSHGAIVARELGVPCVINTRSGTRALRTGQRVRVDGTAGTVAVLEPAPGT